MIGEAEDRHALSAWRADPSHEPRVNALGISLGDFLYHQEIRLKIQDARRLLPKAAAAIP